ncbi:hypothetical protein JXB31_03005 [Candidatus Woesearchaeota archaeon]|nr:hypothetical protein [Candidatus Woesearchaeota archaeon]
MQEEINCAREELKRVDHLIYVSLKYTRTVDVLKNVIERLMNSFGHMLKAVLVVAMEKKEIDKVPDAPVEMATKAKELYTEDKNVQEIVDFYILLRKIMKAEYESENEYRRYVRMKANVEGRVIDVEIDSVTEYYKKAQDYVLYIEENFK